MINKKSRCLLFKLKILLTIITILIQILIVATILNEHQCCASACGIQINSTNADLYENSPLILQVTSSSSSHCIFNISSVSRIQSIQFLDAQPSVRVTLIVSNVTFETQGISVFTDWFDILTPTTTTTAMSTSSSSSFSAPLQIIVDSCSFGGGIVNVTSYDAMVQSSSAGSRRSREVSVEVSNCEFAISYEPNQLWGAINVYGLRSVLSAKIINNTITSKASCFSMLDVENVGGDIQISNNSLTTLCDGSNVINVSPLRFFRIKNMSSGGFIVQNNNVSLFESVFTRTVVDFQGVSSVAFILIDNNTLICERTAMPKHLPRRVITLNQTLQALGGVRITNNYFRMNAWAAIGLELWQISGYGRGRFASDATKTTNSARGSVDFVVEGNTFDMATPYEDGRAATGVRIGYAGTAADSSQDYSVGQFDSFQVINNRFILRGARSSNQWQMWPLSDSYFTMFGVVFMRIWYVRDIIVKFNNFSLTSPIDYMARSNVISLMTAISSDPSGELVDVAQIQMTENVVTLNGAAGSGAAIFFVPREDRVQSSFNNNNNNGTLLQIVNFSSNFVDATNLLLLDETVSLENAFLRALMPSTSKKPGLLCFFFATTTELFIVESSTCIVSEQRLELFQPVLHFVEYAAINPFSTLSKLVLRNNNFTMIPSVDDAERTKIYFNITSSAYINKGKGKLLPISTTYFVTGHFGLLFFGPMVGVDEYSQKLKKVIVENNFVSGSGATVCSAFIVAMFEFGINTEDVITKTNGEVFSIKNNTLSYTHVAVSLNVIIGSAAAPFRLVSTIGYFCFYSLNVEVVIGIGNQPRPSAVSMPNPFFSAIQLGNITSEVSTAVGYPVVVFSNNRINYSTAISPSSNVNADKFGTFPICTMMNISLQKKSATTCLGKFVLMENNQGSFADCESGSLVELSVTGNINNTHQESFTLKNNVLKIARSPTVGSIATSSFLPDYTFRKDIFMIVGMFFWASSSPTNAVFDVNLFNNFIVNTSSSSSSSINPNYYYKWKPILQFPPDALLLRILNISAAPNCNSIFGNGITDDSLQGSTTLSPYSSQKPSVVKIITGKLCRAQKSRTRTKTAQRERSLTSTFVEEKKSDIVKKNNFFSPSVSTTLSSTALVLASLAASATTAGMAIRTRTILSGVAEIMMNDCGSPFTEEIFETPPLISASPTQMYFSGVRNGGYATGLIVGDFILILVLVGTWFLVFVLKEKYLMPFLQSRKRSSPRKRNFNKNIFTLKFLAKSAVTIPAFNFGLMFLDPMFNSSIALIFIKEVGMGWKILGVVISILLLLIGFFFFTVIYKLLVSRNQIEKWHKFRPSELKTSKNPVLKLWYLLMDGEGEWLCPKEGKRILKNKIENENENGNNNKKVEIIKVTANDVISWRLTEPVIDGFTNRFPRFAIVDICTMLSLAVALVIGHATANCTIMGIILLFPVAVHLLLVIFYRPDQEFLLRILIPVTDLLQVILVGLALGAVDAKFVTAFASILVAIQMILTVLWVVSIFLTVFDMVREMNFFASTRRRNAEKRRQETPRQRKSAQNLRELMPPKRSEENRRKDDPRRESGRDSSNVRNQSKSRYSHEEHAMSDQNRRSSHRSSASPSSLSSSRPHRDHHEAPSSRPSHRDHVEKENRNNRRKY